MKKLILLLAAILTLSGCTQFQTPETPREGIAAAYVAVDSLADGVRIAKRDGHITAEERDSAVNQLLKAMSDIATAEKALKAYESTGDPAQKKDTYYYLSRAQSVLSMVEIALQEAQ